MKYSVIIPLYNKAEYIQKTIESVLAQTEQDFEVIVIDDGSTDDGAQVVEQIQSDKIKLIKQKNSGVSKVRNCGIKSACGEYVAFLDADDLWSPNFLETVNLLIEEFPDAGMACPSYQVAYENRIVHPEWRSVEDSEKHLVNDFFEMATAPFWVCNSSCAVIKRQVILEMDYWFPENESVYEDFDFWIRIGASQKVAHSNIVCSTYNRITETNARKTHYSSKVVYSQTFMNTLNNLMENNQYSLQQKNWLKQIKDRRMVPYIFSLLCVNNRKQAIEELKGWKPTKAYKKFKYALRTLSFMPLVVFQMIQKFRYKLF